MAAYTSTQNGNFNSAATWGGGGFPNANGDTFTITNGHTVTYNISGTISDGFGDSNIYGHLVHSTDVPTEGVTELKMNGNLNVRTNGLYEMVDNSVLVFKGDNSDDHGLNVRAEAGASFLATGTSPTLETRLSSSGDVGDAYFGVDSSTNFQTGDWCSIHYRYHELKNRASWIANTGYPTGPLSGDGVNQSRSSWESSDQGHNESSRSLDEGFIVHEVAYNKLYPRCLIGPEATIVNARPDSVIVSDSRVFRVGQKVVFGHSSRGGINCLEISNINNNRNIIFFTSNITSPASQIGETIYLGGAISHHYAKSVVRRVASMVASHASKDATSITINDASDYSVGDEFYVDHIKTDDETFDQLFPNDNNNWYLDTNKRHLISNKSGNTLTFSPALPHAVAANTFLYKANRKITIRGADYSVDKPYVYFQSRTTTATIDGQSRYDRKLLIKDIQFLGLGNSSSSYQLWFRGGYNDGYWRFSHTCEGVVVDGMGNTNANYIRADSYQRGIWRNWIVANMYRGGYSGNQDNCIFNSVYLNCRRSNENRYTYYRNGRYWFNRCVRIREYDYARSPSKMGGMTTHYQNYYNGEYGIYLYGDAEMFQCEIHYRYYPIRGYFATQKSIAYSKCVAESINNNDETHYESSRSFDRYEPTFNLLFKDKDYILGNDFIYSGGVAKCWKEEEGAYRVYGGRLGGYHDPDGSYQEIEIPPKATIRVTAEAKLPATTYSNGTSWTYCPHLIYYLISDRNHYSSSYSDQYHNSDFFSDNKNSRYRIRPDIDANFGGAGRFNYDGTDPAESYRNTPFNSKTQYNSKTITITNDSWFPKKFRVGFCSVSSNARLGWWEKPLRIAITNEGGIGNRRLNTLKKVGEYIFKIGVSTVNNIKRIGGSRF
jgi:hypothetical protein